MQDLTHDCTTCHAYSQGGMAARLEAIEQQMEAHAKCLKENTQTTEQIKNDTKEIRELMELGRAAFKLLNYMGKAIKWVAGIAASLGGLYALWQKFRQ